MIWSLPAIFQHIFFQWLVKFGPICYFVSGMLFAYALEVYLLLIFLSIPVEKQVQYQRYFVTDLEIKNSIFKQQEWEKPIGMFKPIRIEDIDDEEVKEMKYVHDINYPDSKRSPEFYQQGFTQVANNYLRQENRIHSRQVERHVSKYRKRGGRS